MQKHQHGMTFIGLLCILALAGVVVYAGVRLTPVYLNYMKIARTMESVASEVKGLATQAAKATDEIKTQISSIQTTTGQAVAAIRSISGTISGMHDIAVEITASVEQQGAATQDIASNVSQAARGTTEVSRNIVGITDASRTVGSAASQVFEAAERLTRQSELLRDELRNFTATVRAA